MVGVVVLQGVEHIPALGGQCGEGVTIHIAAGSIRGAVGAVTAHREHCCIQPLQRRSRCKGKLLIPSAETLAGQVDDRLAACDVGQLFSLPRVGPDDGAKEAARLPGFTAELVGQQDGLIAKLPAGGSGSGAKLPHTASDLGRHIVQHLGRFLRQKNFCLFRELQVILLRNGKRLCASRGIRHRRAAGYHIQRVAQNIAQHDAEYLSRGACLREPPALDARKPFADGVHLHDVSATGKELAGDVLQFCLDNVYIQLMLVSTIWLGLIGFLDDYIKVFRHHKEGLKGRFKIVGQVGLGIIVGTTMCFSPDIVVREKTTEPVETIYLDEHGRTIADHIQRRIVSSESRQTTQTTIPFVKDNEFDYSWLTGGNRTLTWILYVVVAILVVTAVSNGANLTDGLDGLVTGVSAPIVLVLGILAYLSGHIVYADYLNIMYIPGSGELVVFAAALAGALVGFLWYNSFPAQIFMGDTGSLSIGGIIAVFALCIRKELLLPLLCGIFLVESLSVMLQVSYFKYTKRKYGEGRRILLMSPLHHHYQKQGFFETKIVTRFWIVSLLLAAITLVTLKIR